MYIFSIPSHTNFKAGKVHLFSDFDGTYFPVREKDIERGEKKEFMKKYSKKMRKFFDATKGDLHFNITTGRDYDSYMRISGFLADSKISMPLPKLLITDNGNDIYEKVGEDADFYSGGTFPYKHKSRSEQKIVDKVQEARYAVKRAIRDNDLVITAGDSSNDYKMLNPLEYIENNEWEEFKRSSSCKKFYEGDMHKKLRDLKSVYNGNNKELKIALEKDGLLKKIDSMPIFCIVMKRESPKLDEITDTFLKSGKVIMAERGELDKDIKKIIKYYSSVNKDFKNSMSDKFKNVIFKTKHKMIYIITAIITVLGASFGLYEYKNRISYK